MTSKIWSRITWILWVLLIIALPITTFPLVMKLTRSSSVAPASLLFLLPLIVFVVPGILRNKSPLPFHTKAVLLFFGYAMITILLAFLRPIPDYKEQTLSGAALEGAATLILGLLFYFVSISIPNTPGRINKTLRIVNWTGLAVVAWSILQMAVQPFLPAVFLFFERIQALFSPNRILQDRMLGFAAEPSWLAHMLNLVFLAYWLAATFNGSSVHKWRFRKITFENILLVLGVVVVVGTLSRGGLLAFMLVIFLIFLLLNIKMIKWIVNRFPGRKRVLLTAGVSLVLIFGYLSLLLAGLWGLSKVDPRMETVFEFSKGESNALLEYAENLQFGERVVYWQTGWNIFNDYPVFGVGVGVSGFYFPQYLPDAGWGLAEARRLLYHNTGLLNIKNLWSRLLAETGIIGFALFINFLVIFSITSVEMIRKGNGMRKTLGYMGIFFMVALIAEEFSVDSFALPYLWFSMGLVTAAWRWYTPSDGELNG